MVPLIVVVMLLRCSLTFQTEFCANVFNLCRSEAQDDWQRCYEDKIWNCRQGRQTLPDFINEEVNTSQGVEKDLKQHKVHIPLSALQSSQGADQAMVPLVISLHNSTYFRARVPLTRSRIIRPESHGGNDNEKTVLGDSVLFVKIGQNSVKNLLHPVQLVFKNNHGADNGTCVFWKPEGIWSREGCHTSVGNDDYICSCDHLSFFAVLVNPKVSVDSMTAVNLIYISTVGSALSVICSLLSLIIYTCLQRRRPDKSIGVHMQLTGAILCLHLCFLLGHLWAWLEGAGWACKVFGALLHWSLLGTFTWTAIEGFHIYLLLVRVFNIYIKKYLLKLSLVGWGLPTVVVLTCGGLDIYGEHTTVITDSGNIKTPQICWIKNTNGTNAINILMLTCLGLVLLFNAAMLGLVVAKLWNMRSTSMSYSRGTSGRNVRWKIMDKEKRSRLCKDVVTVLGLSCVLGITWSLSYTTYSSLSVGLYLFTILNSLLGVFMFLWSLALTCKSRSENDSSAQEASSKKMTETSFNN